MHGISQIRIDNSAAIHCGAPARRLICLVLLLAVKDRATEVRFEPSESEGVWKLRYKVSGVWEELAPPPLILPISAEICRMVAKWSGFLWRHRPFASLNNKSVRIERTLRSIIAGKRLEVMVTVDLGRSGMPGLVILRLPIESVPAEEAEQILRVYLDDRDSGREQIDATT